MTTPPDPYPWLPTETVYGYLGLSADSPNAVHADRARDAAADYVQQARSDLWFTDPVALDRTYRPGPAVVTGALMAAARIYSRRASPVGMQGAAYGEFAAAVVRNDADIDKMLGIGRYAKPAVG